MQTYDLIQHSPEWHAYRAKHFNASDAPAMMGVSPYKKRTELLHERATGIVKEIDATTQARFDDGHRFEALARTLAEEIIGDDLYPVTGSDGKLSASFDGLTMDEETAWEHKTLNDDIRAAATVDELGEHLRVQMEQQLAISGAKQCLFLASKWDMQGQLVEKKHFWYTPDLALRERLVAGWAQFERDLADFVPKELAEKPTPAALMQLPALAVHIRGEVTLSNLPEFKAAAERFIAAIKTDLQTDEDFANAEETVKFCAAAEKDLELTKASAIAQTASIDEMMRTIDFIQAELRTKRLMLDKLVKLQKDVIKAKILADAKGAFEKHAATLESEIAPIRLVYQSRDFAGAMNNKRTLASLHDAVDTELAAGKIALDAAAQAIRSRLAWFKSNATEHAFLFNDLQTIIQKPADDFELLVTNRIAEHQKKEDEKLEAVKATLRIEALATLAKDKAEFDAAEAQKVIVGTVTPPASLAPVSQLIGAVQNTVRTFMASTPPAEPTDAQIIEVLALHFRVHESKVIAWLLNMDLSAESEKLAAEFS